MHIGIYHNELIVPVATDEELIEALQAGGYGLCADQNRIERINNETREREKVIREYIAQGKSALEYQLETGKWQGYYDRVMLGKSYEI